MLNLMLITQQHWWVASAEFGHQHKFQNPPLAIYADLMLIILIILICWCWSCLCWSVASAEFGDQHKFQNPPPALHASAHTCSLTPAPEGGTREYLVCTPMCCVRCAPNILLLVHNICSVVLSPKLHNRMQRWSDMCGLKKGRKFNCVQCTAKNKEWNT